MQETLREFCRRYKVIFDEEPQSLPWPSGAWCITDTDGQRWVVKPRMPQDQTVEMLSNFQMLHPTFRFTDPVSDNPEDQFWLYAFIDGEILRDGPFEDPQIIDQLFEVAGRLQALLRSMVLVPFYRETLRSNETNGILKGEVSRFDFSRIQMMDDRQKTARHLEIAQSYQWTQRKLEDFARILEAHSFCSKGLVDELRDRMNKKFSIHLPITGSNLAHTALHPEHLLLHPGKPWGIVGWHIEPRPRFYMIYTYLAWSFVHSSQKNAKAFYQEYLARNSKQAFHDEHHLVFALCLMEQIAGKLAKTTDSKISLAPERERELVALLKECVSNLSQ